MHCQRCGHHSRASERQNGDDRHVGLRRRRKTCDSDEIFVAASDERQRLERPTHQDRRRIVERPDQELLSRVGCAKLAKTHRKGCQEGRLQSGQGRNEFCGS